MNREIQIKKKKKKLQVILLFKINSKISKGL